MSDSLSYVYAVTRGADPARLDGLVGIDGSPVRLVLSGDLQAVTADVDRADFEARALEEHLEDLVWLETTVRAHHHVVDTVGHAHVVAPLALATVYFDDDRVREVLEAGRPAFERVLDRLAGRGEWGVKAFAPPARRAQQEERPRSGAEYLRARRRALREGNDSQEAAINAAERFHEAAEALASDSRRHRLQDASLSGSSDPMVLNGAYLVAEADAEAFRELVESWAGRSEVRLELTGPWVPYSFVRWGESA